MAIFLRSLEKNREGKPPVESPYDDAFVEQLKPYIPFLQEVKFYGGEPFMILIYYKIWELAVQLNPSIRLSIQTNATMLNSRIKDLLEAGNFHINISLDAVTREVYEAIRLNAKFDAVMENVNWFIDYCKRKNTFIGISACAMQQNWRDIPNILTFCTKKQVQLYLHTVFFSKRVYPKSF
jgi:sulfatase maturation enzyme AslB (radical SAM superfamily)